MSNVVDHSSDDERRCAAAKFIILQKREAVASANREASCGGQNGKGATLSSDQQPFEMDLLASVIPPAGSLYSKRHRDQYLHHHFHNYDCCYCKPVVPKFDSSSSAGKSVLRLPKWPEFPVGIDWMSVIFGWRALSYVSIPPNRYRIDERISGRSRAQNLWMFLNS